MVLRLLGILRVFKGLRSLNGLAGLKRREEQCWRIEGRKWRDHQTACDAKATDLL